MRDLVNRGILAAFLIVAQVLSASEANHYNLAFSTYISGMNGDYVRDVCVDNRGDIIAVGGTSSPDFPTTAGAYCRTYHTGGQSLGDFGPMDVFVIKALFQFRRKAVFDHRSKCLWRVPCQRSVAGW